MTNLVEGSIVAVLLLTVLLPFVLHNFLYRECSLAFDKFRVRHGSHCSYRQLLHWVVFVLCCRAISL